MQNRGKKSLKGNRRSYWKKEISSSRAKWS